MNGLTALMEVAGDNAGNSMGFDVPLALTNPWANAARALFHSKGLNTNEDTILARRRKIAEHGSAPMAYNRPTVSNQPQEAVAQYKDPFGSSGKGERYTFVSETPKIAQRAPKPSQGSPI